MEKNCAQLDAGEQYARTVEEYNDGALFITFHLDGDPVWPEEFVTVDGKKIDEVEIVNQRDYDLESVQPQSRLIGWKTVRHRSVT